MEPLNILIVEDEAVVAMDMRMMLEGLGYNVLSIADNYDEAIEILCKEHPDLVMCDISIVGSKNGIDLAAEIHKNYNIPFIFCTSHADKGTVKKAMEIKPNGYLVKPFTKEDLFTSIEVAAANFNEGDKIDREDKYKVKDSLFIKMDKLFTKVRFDDILYLQSDSNYIKVVTAKSNYLVRMSFRELLAKLPEGQFYQTHKSYFINLNALEGVNASCVLINEQEIPLSRNYKEDLLKKLTKIV